MLDSEETASRTAVNNTPGQSGDNPNPEAWAGIEEKDALVVAACRLDTEHWEKHQRPISAETLRRELRVGSQRARALARVVRSHHQPGSPALVAT